MTLEISHERLATLWLPMCLGALSILLCSFAAALERERLSQQVASADSTRIVPLYHAEDADAVMALVRGRRTDCDASADQTVNEPNWESVPPGELALQTTHSGSPATTGPGRSLGQVQMGLAGKGGFICEDRSSRSMRLPECSMKSTNRWGK
jgi:hypothetical protein